MTVRPFYLLDRNRGVGSNVLFTGYPSKRSMAYKGNVFHCHLPHCAHIFTSRSGEFIYLHLPYPSGHRCRC